MSGVGRERPNNELLGLDKSGKLDAGELQQLDRLQQLRRHHQGLALSQNQPGR